jgi:hypothetical protein
MLADAETKRLLRGPKEFHASYRAVASAAP